MVDVGDEINANYIAFSKKVSVSITSNIADFQGNKKLVESYARIAAINALKLDIVEPHFPQGAAHFFFEAHNDALISHVNASFGSWRSALQALRSFMENTMAAIYYLDHPVEFVKWSAGDFRMSPKEMREYISEHPKLDKLAKELDLKAALDNEYGTLSKAVHGSNMMFRMTTADGKTNIANPSLADLGKWSARERSAVDISITSLVGVLSDHLDGAKMQNLRAALSIAIQSNARAALKKHLDVSIHAP
ncbi:hypothetical protein [Pacificibacter marinus]|uniref:hypothetical protein n=1 Tax=Pacificibacter marinus TaxID=658057 RepID=UPI001C07719E|nr:hypothetical protein [Pacificibacter marinus]MBU2866015.1 hypothetical protein [Pacificibacter marinus]